MNKILILVRHAQSAGIQGARPDYDRELTHRGQQNAKNLGSWILQQGFTPDYILSSSAVRARQTTELLNEKTGIPASCVQHLNELYEGPATRWMDKIHHLPDGTGCAILVGHNPTLSILASDFRGKRLDLPPCGTMVFAFPFDEWNKIIGPGKELATFAQQY